MRTHCLQRTATPGHRYALMSEPYPSIHDYGIIGDMNSAALVSVHGSIDWACFPRFDSPSTFAAILDGGKGGRFALSPTNTYSSSQRYEHDTTLLETTFSTDSGSVTVTDFMAIATIRKAESPHEIIRIVGGVSGKVRMRLVFQPRLDYAQGSTTIAIGPNGAVARHGGKHVALVSGLPLVIESADDGGEQAVAEFDVEQGQTFEFVVAYGIARISHIDTVDIRRKLEHARASALAMVEELEYDGRWRDLVVRSVLTLHMLTYGPTGAIVAAPTTSLPEFIGGERNWDYRYSWLRDSAWAVGILYRLGDADEGEEFVEFLVDRCQLGIGSMQILYGISEESVLEEHTLDHLEGYRGSGPVRVGNDAAFHRQLDVFGAVAHSLATYHKHHGTLSEDAWHLLSLVADLAAASWHLPDNGIWEVRGQLQHFVYSKIMCWVALDRAAALAEVHGHAEKVPGWRAAAAEIHADILTNGWSDTKQSFVQAYGREALDASALMIPFLGFLPADDPRVRSTIKAVREELADGPFVHRYIAEETDDGFSEGEGAFFILSFWLIGALLSIGENDEAERMFEEVTAVANPLGLFAEMWDPSSGDALGNFPQAFSHIGFIHTARNLSD